MVMNYGYRVATLADLNKIMEIYAGAQAFMEVHGNPQWPKGFPDENDVHGGISGGVLYVVTCKTEIAAAFAIAGYDRDYDDIDGKWLTGGNYIAVHRVAVAENFRGNGAAKYIVDHAAVDIARSRRRKSIRMDTHEKNIPMRSLLVSQGFTQCGIITLLRDGTTRVAFERIIK